MAGMPVWLSTMLLGIGTVFVGLIVLIFITKLSSAIIIAIEKKKSASAPAVAAVDEQEAAIPNRGTLVAVVAACVAEVMGKDISGLRIVSLKRVD